MNEKIAKKILFFTNDFKTDLWEVELNKFNYEVVHRERRFISHIKILVSGHFKNEKIHAFIFRYLNDDKSLYESTLYLFRDILIICICKLFRIKILWILHNINRESQQHYPVLSLLRRKIVYLASKKVLVTDPKLIEVAEKYGVSRKKVDWLCFGKPMSKPPNQKNVELKKKIKEFREQLQNLTGKVCLGLCVSEPARKKLHYLLADSIVGISKRFDSVVVGLVLIGKFPDGQDFEDAKKRVQESPHILFIDDTFEVNESYISGEIDFFYRSLGDQSVPYTLYVAANERKPIVTHNFGALPLLIKTERLGYTIEENGKDIPVKISDHVDLWLAEGAEQFLKHRTWKVAATQLIKAIEG